MDAAGKTTILYKLKLGEVVTTIPTIGFNVESIEYNGLSITAWDVGMRDKMRPLIRHYYQGTQVLIFVVDSSDRERMDDVKHDMELAFEEDELRDAKVLVLANKQDIKGALTAEEVAERLEISKYNRNQGVIPVFPTCATTGEGLTEALDWIESELLCGEGDKQKVNSGDSDTWYFSKLMTKMKSLLIDWNWLNIYKCVINNIYLADVVLSSRWHFIEVCMTD